jgi:hypothetical protein
MNVFVSHITEEATVATAVKLHLERAVPGVSVFVSSTDIMAGREWLGMLSSAIDGAALLIVLCSRRSVARTWVNFESGAGWGRGVDVIPLCHGGLRSSELPFPLVLFQVIDAAARGGVEDLVRVVAAKAGVGVARDFKAEAMKADLVPAPPPRTDAIGIVLAHGQDGWDDGAPTSVFALPDSLPAGVGNRWTFRRIQRAADLFSDELHELRGIVVGAPWRSHMSAREVDALVGWVNEGGRLLMLGFELGDRHHDGNLNDLASRFGIHFATDIIGPPGESKSKPYGDEVVFRVMEGDPHTLTAGLDAVSFTNVQTVRVDPGGAELLRVGDNAVCVPARETVRYRNGTLTQAGSREVTRKPSAGWVPVVVAAPPGMAGTGAVIGIGTWQLLGDDGRFVRSPDTLSFYERLLDWLAGRLD